MPNFIKNAMNQIEFIMVDKTDFATIESGITESDFNSAATKKFYGVNHGVSDAFTSGAISKTTKLVRSGIFQQTLKAAECNYDYIVYRFTHPSCADQILIFQPLEIDPSDTLSAAQQANSRILVVQSRVSDIESAIDSQFVDQSNTLSDLRSVLIVMSGVQSDIYSALSDMQSDFQSRVPKRVATDSQLSDLHSDLLSVLVVNQSAVSDLISQVSDFRSDLISHIDTTGVHINASDMSDLRSAIAGVTATLSVSDISDIASAVDAILASRLSDILSAAVQTNSRALVVQSRVSDVESALDSQFSDLRSVMIVNQSAVSDLISQVSDFRSDLISHIDTTGVHINASDMSDLRSAIAAGPAATITASDISDIASAVDAILASRLSDILSAAVQTNSRVLINQSRVSDVYSLLSDFQSDLISHIDTTGVHINASDMSDLRSAIAGVTATLSVSDISDIASAVDAILASRLSDTLSAAQQGNSRILVVQSRVSDVESALDSQFAYESNALSDLLSVLIVNQSVVSDIRSHVSDLQSDFQSRVPKETAARSQLSDLASNIDSQLLVNQSVVSDIYSLLSDFRSDLISHIDTTGVHINASDMSDIRSAVAGVTATLSTSDISDIASAVDVILASRLSDILSATQQGNSRLLVNQSRVSDIYSLLSDVQSDFQSRVPKRVATDSQLSDVNSDLRSLIGVGFPLSASDMSDIRSAINAVNVVLTASDISDLASAVVAGLSGGGAKQVTITVEDNGNPLEGADVWVTTDIAGLNVIARLTTDTLGHVTFYLDPGTYYFWKQLSGYNFTNPEAKTVT